MVNSGKYMISAALLMSANGQMREDTASAYWSIVMGQKASVSAVKALLYTPIFSTASRFVLNTTEPEMLNEATEGTSEVGSPGTSEAGPSGTSEAGPSGISAEDI